MSTDPATQPPIQPAPAPAPEAAAARPADLVWKPYPGDPNVYLYGHESVLRIFLDGWIRLLDQDGAEIVALAGKGTQRAVMTTFQAPNPDPGQPHICTVEVSADCFGPDGKTVNGGYQVHRADQA